MEGGLAVEVKFVGRIAVGVEVGLEAGGRVVLGLRIYHHSSLGGGEMG